MAVMITITVFMSFFSAFGWIEVTQRASYTGTYLYIKPISPLPISFPFISRVYLFDSTRDSNPVEVYDLFFLGMQINREYTASFPAGFLASKGFLYYSFFLLVNIIGSIIGYWINTRLFVRFVLGKKRKSSEEYKESVSILGGKG